MTAVVIPCKTVLSDDFGGVAVRGFQKVEEVTLTMTVWLVLAC